MHAAIVAILNRRDMPKRQIYHVNIIAYIRTVGGILIVAEYIDTGQFSAGNLRHERHKVVGDTLRVFAD